MHISLNLSIEYLHAVTEMARFVKLLPQAVGACESITERTELGVRKSKAVKPLSAKIIQSQTMTSFCMTKITNQVIITTLCMATKTTNQIRITGFFTYLIHAIMD